MPQVNHTKNPDASSPLPPVSLNHLTALLGPHGLYQHAIGRQPRLSEGYCTDDNARAVQVLVRLKPRLSGDQRQLAEDALQRCWQFVMTAEHQPGGLFNFRTAEGQWLSHDVSGDMYARVLRCCAALIAEDDNPDRLQAAGQIAANILRRFQEHLASPRAWAETLLALAALPEETVNSLPAKPVIKFCLERLSDAWQQQATPDWPWFEASLTYANALLPHGLLAAAAYYSSKSHIRQIAAQAAKFLITATINSHGTFTPIGNAHWYVYGQDISVYDQQPIEAGTMLDFLLDAGTMLKPAPSVAQIAAPYLWFFGYNMLGLPLADATAGACADGLNADGLNPNYGAESLLAYLWAQARLHGAPPPVRAYAAAKLSAAPPATPPSLSPT